MRQDVPYHQTHGHALFTFMIGDCVCDFMCSRTPPRSPLDIRVCIYQDHTCGSVCTCTHRVHKHTSLGKALERNTHQIALNGCLRSQLTDDFYFLYFPVFSKFPAMYCLTIKKKVTYVNPEFVPFVYSI